MKELKKGSSTFFIYSKISVNFQQSKWNKPDTKATLATLLFLLYEVSKLAKYTEIKDRLMDSRDGVIKLC